jgi:hypothetical protein
MNRHKHHHTTKTAAHGERVPLRHSRVSHNPPLQSTGGQEGVEGGTTRGGSWKEVPGSGLGIKFRREEWLNPAGGYDGSWPSGEKLGTWVDAEAEVVRSKDGSSTS